MSRKTHRLLFPPTLAGIALAIGLGAPGGFADWEPETLRAALSKARETLVTVEFVSGFEGFGQSREIPRKLSGMVVSPTGLVMVMTNVEVMESARGSLSLSRPEKVQIVFQDRSRRKGAYIGVDADLRVSFFEVEREADAEPIFEALELATADLGVGSSVAAVRLLPEEYEPRLEAAFARVSAVLEKPRRLFRTQPVLAQFNGFPAFLPDGRVVGFFAPEEGGDRGEEALAILTGSLSVQPAALYLEFIRRPPTKPEKGWLGILMEPLRRDLAEAWSLPVEGGIIVTDTVRDSPAEKAGLEAEDVIVSLGKRPLAVNTYADLDWFRQQVRNLKPGDAIDLEVIRGAAGYGKRPVEHKQLTVTLTQAPPSRTEARTLSFPEIGLKVRELTLDFILANRLPDGVGGVVADYVERAGPADIGQVKEDDVVLSIGGVPIQDLPSANQAFDALRKKKPSEIILHVLRGQSRLFLKVTPDWE